MVTAPAIARPVDERVILHGVSWETYQSLLAGYVDRPAPRFAYDQGTLEIVVTLSTVHDEINRIVNDLIVLVAEELGIEFRSLGSMTFKREDLRQGFEPDSCFYFQNEPRVRGKVQIDPQADPPPDLVIEIEVSEQALNKLPIDAAFGIPEVWRITAGRGVIVALHAGTYCDVPGSRALPPLTAETLSQFLRDSRQRSRLAWMQAVRGWAEEQAAGRAVQ
jgi:Uma2 family endonuclease